MRIHTNPQTNQNCEENQTQRNEWEKVEIEFKIWNSVSTFSYYASDEETDSWCLFFTGVSTSKQDR